MIDILISLPKIIAQLINDLEKYKNEPSNCRKLSRNCPEAVSKLTRNGLKSSMGKNQLKMYPEPA